ncbi:MAG: DUF1800 family protein, partial [Chitinophagales bacterium]|nr:DUF1800 family protein [Chitinophagales bacterium]
MKEPVILSYSLSPFSGEFNTSHLMHLLRRTLFGVGHKDLAFFSGKNLEDCLAILLKQSSTIDQVLQGDEEFEDPYVPKGKTWVNAPFENTIIDTRRRLMLKMWWVENIITRDFSLTEKMTLFWHNHFVTEMDVVKDSRYSYSYVALLRKHALG